MKTKQKLFRRFFGMTACIILASLTFMVVILSFFVTGYMAQEKRQLLGENCGAIARYFQTARNEENYTRNVAGIARAISSTSDAQSLLVDRSGRVTVCTCSDWADDNACIHSQKPIPASVLSRALESDFYEVGNLGGYFDDLYYTAGQPLRTADGSVEGVVFSFSTSASLRAFFGNLFRMYLISALVPLVVIFFSEYALIYRLTKPIRLMSDAARSMAKGDFSKRIPVTSDDEIGELSIAFNQMTNSLSQLEGMRRSFVANVSHELKTPMTTIGGFIDGIRDGTIEPEKQDFYLRIVSEEIKRLSRLVQSMLNLAKLESGEQKLNPKRFSLSDLVCDVVVSQEQRIEQNGIQIVGLDQLEPVEVRADRDLIYQAIYNLVDNAVKFTNPSGTISFAVTVRQQSACVKITNTGEGIPARDLPFIFERFYKSDRSRSKVKDSTGLGLYLVKTIIGIHGGSVTADSVPDKETTFEFTIPLECQ